MAAMEVILTHEHADFDALASLLAASKLYPEAIPVLPRNMNRNLRDFLTLYRDSLPFRRADELPRRKITQAYFVDTQTAQAVRGMTSETPVRIIDHHTQERDLPDNYHYWGEQVGATTTLLVEQIISRGIQITPIEATLLLLGIYEDTGSLSYVSTTARDLSCAAWLLDKGANLEVVNDFLHHPLTPAQQRLLKQLGDNAQAHNIAGHTVVITCAAVSEPVEEISTLAHKLRDLFDPDGLFLIVDLQDRIQLVARSTTTHIDVGNIAEQLGGGGHARAAAALIRDMTLAEVEERLLALLREHIRPPVTVEQIMSWGLTTLPEDMSVAEADRRMRRLGHEGFPVVDEEGKLRGLITRRLIDRAIHHHLDKAPLRRIMREGSYTIHMHDSVQALQKLMMETGWGQIPVADDSGRLVGIVTRTDLLKLWARSEEEMAAPSLALKMEAALPGGLLRLLREVGETAHQLGLPLYAVGGFVRDLLLGRTNFDLDLVVEGDAAALALELAGKHGGRVRRHKRFGTAKWIRDDEAFAQGRPLEDDTPASLDFATARTEFYEEATALPVVERSSIKLDLHRRDFTINTLAVRLDGNHWGELLDFYGGQRDLEDGVIRVLHSLSFIEDPTRILRAVRFEQRFGFRIEPRTEELIGDAVELLGRISGARLRHEINLILLEERPEDALRRLHELGVLEEIDPALRWCKQLDARFAALREEVERMPSAPDAIDRLYLALWLYRLSAATHRRLIERLRLNARSRALLQECERLRDLTDRILEPELSDSRLDELLEKFSDAALLVARVDSDDWRLSKRLHHYQVNLRPRSIHLRGSDLLAMGIKPGPIYREIFREVRAAMLDGRISSREEELELARALLARHAAGKR
ncbi:MAG: CBS domain-containing protein [Chloroflexi bacterium]|nr:MAG: CBS domain-containing protein [Chloroflexota bacterium]